MQLSASHGSITRTGTLNTSRPSLTTRRRVALMIRRTVCSGEKQRGEAPSAEERERELAKAGHDDNEMII